MNAVTGDRKGRRDWGLERQEKREETSPLGRCKPLSLDTEILWGVGVNSGKKTFFTPIGSISIISCCTSGLGGIIW